MWACFRGDWDYWQQQSMRNMFFYDEIDEWYIYPIDKQIRYYVAYFSDVAEKKMSEALLYLYIAML